jgi:hypothetical protein
MKWGFCVGEWPVFGCGLYIIYRGLCREGKAGAFCNSRTLPFRHPVLDTGLGFFFGDCANQAKPRFKHGVTVYYSLIDRINPNPQITNRAGGTAIRKAR